VVSFRLWSKNRKGLSPIFATVILVAIVIIFGSVAYYYASNLTNAATNNYSSTLSSNQQEIGERICFEMVFYNQSTSTLTIYVINNGMTNNLEISSVFIYDLNHNIIGSPYSNSQISQFYSIGSGTPLPANNGLNAGQEAYFNVLNVQQSTGTNLTPGTIYTCQLTTQRGSVFSYEFTA